MPLLRTQLAQQGIAADRIVFVDDAPGPQHINGQRLLAYADFLATPAQTRYATLAIANSDFCNALIHCHSGVLFRKNEKTVAS